MTPQEFKKIREDLELTQEQFGKHLGFSDKGARRSVGAFENGERPIKNTVANLARILHENPPAK